MVYKFRKLDKLLRVDGDDLKSLISLVNGEELRFKLPSFLKDDELAMDLINLIEFCKQESIEGYTSLINQLVKCCLMDNLGVSVQSNINRLYKRGFIEEITHSILDFYKEIHCSGAHRGKLGNYESTLQICWNLLRIVSKYIQIIELNGKNELYIEESASNNLIEKCINLLISSYISDKEWNMHALMNLYHPFSRCLLPDVIQLIVIDHLPPEVRLELLNRILVLWSDSQLILQFNEAYDITLSSCICRILPSLDETIVDLIIGYITNGINFRLGSFDKYHRLSAMAVAESFNNVLRDGNGIKFDELHEFKGSSLLFAATSKPLIGSRLPFHPTNSPRNIPAGGDISESLVTNDTSSIRNIVGGAKEEHSARGNEMSRHENTNTDQTSPSLDDIFINVPRIIGEDVEVSIKDYWIQPPRHIIQCYERLLGRPVPGDVDIESLLSQDLDKVDNIELDQKIKFTTQALVHLPDIIKKNEPILPKLAVPISCLLIRLEDLHLYNDELKRLKCGDEAIFDVNLNDTNLVDLQIFNILMNLIYKCPLEIFEYFTLHLSDTEYTLPQKSLMILTIQYSIIGLSNSMDVEDICGKYQEDSKIGGRGRNGIDSVKLEPGGENGSLIEVVMKRNDFRKYSETLINCLLSSVKTFIKNGANIECHTEGILIGIIETLIIAFNHSEQSISHSTLTECSEMILFLTKLEISNTLNENIKILAILITNYERIARG